MYALLLNVYISFFFFLSMETLYIYTKKKNKYKKKIYMLCLLFYRRTSVQLIVFAIKLKTPVLLTHAMHVIIMKILMDGL